jgi:transcriptional regulator with XRE-family HTH domain
MVEHGFRSYNALAKAAGINPNTLQNLFKQNRKEGLYAQDLYLLARTFGCTMEELTSGVAPETTPEYSSETAAELCDWINEMDEERLKELRGAMRMYAMTHFTAEEGGASSQAMA